MRFSLSIPEIEAIVNPVRTDGSFDGTITAIAGLSEAKSGELSFLGNPKYAHEVEASRASVLLLPANFAYVPKKDQRIFFCQDASVALAKICHALELQRSKRDPGIHPTAVIHPTAILGEDVAIGPHVVIEAEVHLGSHVTIGAGCFIGERTTIDEYSRLFPNVNIMPDTILGKRVTVHSGAIIGSDGFGFAPIAGKWEKIPQIGNVICEDDTDIGTNTTIDRARFASTVIGQGTKIDNLVQIAHNVKIGRHCIIVSQVGIAGSTTLGDHVVVGGQVGIAGHLHVADGTQIGAQSGVAQDTEKGSKLLGSPATDFKSALKQFACITRLPKALDQLKKILKK
ncbi:MAG: UDP-3-O-(3-hydroxymyristoyl)glucosamine N-acyltransferase [Opitutales bacterium]|nr:UDP-3-O-(3-hydroxymyristoyl)glucosamine N-acyltransferase [Opitutales bacterium]